MTRHMKGGFILCKVVSACIPDVIGLLPRLLVYRAPGREGQCFPFGQGEHVPKLCQENLVEVLIDSACQIRCLACRLWCHDLPLLLLTRSVILLCHYTRKLARGL